MRNLLLGSVFATIVLVVASSTTSSIFGSSCCLPAQRIETRTGHAAPHGSPIPRLCGQKHLKGVSRLTGGGSQPLVTPHTLGVEGRRPEIVVTIVTRDCGVIELLPTGVGSTVGDLKRQAEPLFGVPYTRQRLYCRERLLPDTHRLGVDPWAGLGAVTQHDLLVIVPADATPVIDQAGLSKILAAASLAPPAAGGCTGADEMDERVQRELESRIQAVNIEANYRQAIEHNPEGFGRVPMLYVPCEVNRKEVMALVDTGAEATIMSEGCADRLGVLHLVDRRFGGVAKGVGEGKILGRVHVAPMRLGEAFLTVSFTVLEGKGSFGADEIDFIFGLDNMMRHQCCIDLKARVLRIGEEEIAFVRQKDLRDASSPQGSQLPVHAYGAARLAGAGRAGEATPADPVRALMELSGCTVEEAVGALQAAGGDEQGAAAVLIGE